MLYSKLPLWAPEAQSRRYLWEMAWRCLGGMQGSRIHIQAPCSHWLLGKDRLCECPVNAGCRDRYMGSGVRESSSRKNSSEGSGNSGKRERERNLGSQNLLQSPWIRVLHDASVLSKEHSGPGTCPSLENICCVHPSHVLSFSSHFSFCKATLCSDADSLSGSIKCRQVWVLT